MRLVANVGLCVAAIIVAGCAGPGHLSDEALLIKASALTKLAYAVESAVKYKDAPVQLSESELLAFSTRHDPALLDPFKGDVLRVRRAGQATSVLVCSSDGKEALIEDTACTAISDAHLWKRSPRPVCDFQLDLRKLCGAR
jgi:hypothetical protein